MLIRPPYGMFGEQIPQTPAQPLDIEQEVEGLATLPQVEAVASLNRVDLQPTQPIETQQHRLEKLETARIPAVNLERKYAGSVRQTQPTLQAVSRTSRKVLRWGILVPIYVLLMGSIMVGHAALVDWFGTVLGPTTSQIRPTPAVVIHSRHIHVHSTPIQTEAQTFMVAFMREQWATLWSMLSPDAQRLYHGESDFTHFERAKFGMVRFTNFKTGSTELVQPWFDPDSTRVYPLASVLDVSLGAAPLPGALSKLSVTDLQHGLFDNTTLAMIPRNGQWQVIIAGPADLDAPILVPATPPAPRLLVPIFMYHHVSNLPTSNALDYSLTVTTNDFNAQLGWLQQQGYTSIDMTELFNALYYGKALPPRPMILTFDDGYEDVYTDALPALLAHHDRGVFYIITGMIGGRYMTWNQVRVLREDGMQIASHTVHHVNVGAPPYFTTTQIELSQSKETLQRQLGEPIQFFCYPSGEPFHHDTVYEQQLVLKDLFDDGYIGATLDPFSFESAIQDAQTPYQLPRIRVSGGETLTTFTGILDTVLTYDARQLSSPTGA